MPAEVVAHITDYLGDVEFVRCLLSGRLFHAHSRQQWIARAHARTKPKQAARKAQPDVLEWMRDRSGVRFNGQNLAQAISARNEPNIDWLMRYAETIAHAESPPPCLPSACDSDDCPQKGHALTEGEMKSREAEAPWAETTCWCAATSAAARCGRHDLLERLRDAGLYRPHMMAAVGAAESGDTRILDFMRPWTHGTCAPPTPRARVWPLSRAKVGEGASGEFDSLFAVRDDTKRGAAAARQKYGRTHARALWSNMLCAAANNGHHHVIADMVQRVSIDDAWAAFCQAVCACDVTALWLFVRLRPGMIEGVDTHTLHKRLNAKADYLILHVSPGLLDDDSKILEVLRFLCETLGADAPLSSAARCPALGIESARYIVDRFSLAAPPLHTGAINPPSREPQHDASRARQGDRRVGNGVAHPTGFIPASAFGRVQEENASSKPQGTRQTMEAFWHNAATDSIAFGAVSLFRALLEKGLVRVRPHMLYECVRHPPMLRFLLDQREAVVDAPTLDAALVTAVAADAHDAAQMLAERASTQGLLRAADVALWCFHMSLRHSLLERALQRGQNALSRETQLPSHAAEKVDREPKDDWTLYDKRVNIIDMCINPGHYAPPPPPLSLAPNADGDASRLGTTPDVARRSYDAYGNTPETALGERLLYMPGDAYPFGVFKTRWLIPLDYMICGTVRRAPVALIAHLLDQCECSRENAAKLVPLAIWYNRPDLVHHLLYVRGVCPTIHMVKKAAGMGHFDIVRTMHEHGAVNGAGSAPWDTSVMDAAAGAGKMDIVLFLRQNRTEGCTANAIDGAARRGCLDLVRYLHDHCAAPCTSRAFCESARNGHTEVLRFLLANYGSAAPDPRTLLREAIHGDRPDAVRLLLAHWPTAPITTHTINTALGLGCWRTLAVLRVHRPAETRCMLRGLSSHRNICGCAWKARLVEALCSDALGPHDAH